MGVSTV